MIQERSENQNSTPKGDLLLVGLLILLAVFARVIMNAVRSLPGGALWQLAVVAALCYAGYLIYAKRLVSYRYTLTYEEPAADDLDAFGARRTHPYPLGSLVVERMVGDKGKVYELVMPNEYAALLPPGEAAAQAPGAKRLKLTIFSPRTAYTLVFKRDGRTYHLLFSPSEALAQRLEQVIRELQG